MGDVMPKQIVGPIALQPRGADIGQTVDEEPAIDQPNMLLARRQALSQSLALRAEAPGMAEAENALALLRCRRHAFGIGEIHRDRYLDKDMLAMFERGDRL